MSQSPQPIVPTHGTMHRVLIGLDPALERLGDLLRDSRRGRVNTVVINGESGMGKTSLISEFLTHVRNGARPPRILRAQGDQWEAQLQLAGYSQLIMTSPLRSGKGYDIDIAQTPVGSQALSPDRLMNHAATLGTHLESLQDRSPVLVVIDDAHWIDEASLRILSFVLRRLHAKKVMFVLALDRKQAQGMPATVLDQLTGHEIQQITLEPLDPAAPRNWPVAASTSTSPRPRVMSWSVTPAAILSKSTSYSARCHRTLGIPGSLTSHRAAGCALVLAALWRPLPRISPRLRRRWLSWVRIPHSPKSQRSAASLIRPACSPRWTRDIGPTC